MQSLILQKASNEASLIPENTGVDATIVQLEKTKVSELHDSAEQTTVLNDLQEKTAILNQNIKIIANSSSDSVNQNR